MRGKFSRVNVNTSSPPTKLLPPCTGAPQPASSSTPAAPKANSFHALRFMLLRLLSFTGFLICLILRPASGKIHRETVTDCVKPVTVPGESLRILKARPKDFANFVNLCYDECKRYRNDTNRMLFFCTFLTSQKKNEDERLIHL